MSSAQPQPVTTFHSHRARLAATWTSVFSYGLFGTYIGIGAVPLAFFMSTVRNARQLVDKFAFGLDIVIGPLFACWRIGLDLMWSGIAAGTAAYLVHRLREAALIGGALVFGS